MNPNILNLDDLRGQGKLGAIFASGLARDGSRKQLWLFFEVHLEEDGGGVTTGFYVECNGDDRVEDNVYGNLYDAVREYNEL